MQSIWIVMDSDDDDTRVVAVYESQELAERHVSSMGGWCSAHDVMGEIHPDVTDPGKQAERAKISENARASYERSKIAAERNRRLVLDARPRPPHMSLCHCETFSSRTDGLINWTEHGYCSYCGGWAPAVFKREMGSEAMHEHIDKLAECDRLKMREIVQNI